MKLKDTYITHESDGEQILLDTSSSFAGLIRSNKTAAFIVECLRKMPQRRKSWKQCLKSMMHRKMCLQRMCQM